MKILRAIGLGIVLIIIRIVMPEVFTALQETLLKFFNFLNSVFTFGSEVVSVKNHYDLIMPASINLVP